MPIAPTPPADANPTVGTATTGDGVAQLQQRIVNLEERLRQLQPETDQLKAQLIRAQRMEALSALAGGVAHDFNNVLQTLMGYAQIALMDKAQGHPDHDLWLEVEKAAKKGANLTRQLLMIGRKIKPRCKPMRLNDRIRAVVELLRRTTPRRIEMRMDLTKDLPLVEADETHIDQILMNLTLNACDAITGKGVVTFKTQPQTLGTARTLNLFQVPAGRYSVIAVEDTGMGMTPEVLERAFDPFFTTKETGKGTGLGLAMVFSLVKDHGGYLDCRSAPGRGSTVCLYFPVGDAVWTVAAETTRRALPTDGKGQTVLLVDDEPDILAVGRRLLEAHGFGAAVAENGEAALELFQTRAIDVVILDLDMPGMDGRDCLCRLHAINPSAKIIISSGHRPTLAQDPRLHAAAAFLAKPYDSRELLAVIGSVLGLAGGKD